MEDKEKQREEKQASHAAPSSISTPSVEELTDLLQRTQANFENYRKQMQIYMEETKRMAARDIVLQLLPIIDNFELALKTVNSEKGNKEFIQGIELIHSQLLQVLQQNHVIAMETMGKKFDPYHHEALMKAPSELPAGTIMEEFQKGFIMHGKVLRHAKVKISSGQEQKLDSNRKNNQKNNENKIGGQ